MKVKVFMWLAVRKSILTKDMLQPRGWRGDEKCQFCGGNETIIHLFFSCPLARYIWNLASCVNSFKNKPVSVQHLLGGWMRDSRKSEFFLVTVGVAAILWAIWKTRNNACFRSNTTVGVFLGDSAGKGGKQACAYLEGLAVRAAIK
jgi:hypothetical protein